MCCLRRLSTVVRTDALLQMGGLARRLNLCYNGVDMMELVIVALIILMLVMNFGWILIARGIKQEADAEIEKATAVVERANKAMKENKALLEERRELLQGWEDRLRKLQERNGE